MGFKEDVAEHLSVGLRGDVQKVVAAVLQVINEAEGRVVLLDAFDDNTGQMLIGFKEKGAGQVARNWLKGGYGNLLSAVQRHQSVSPAVSIAVTGSADGRVSLVTKIEDYSHMKGMFSKDLVGRDPHRRFLTDLGLALKRLDGEAKISIGS